MLPNAACGFCLYRNSRSKSSRRQNAVASTLRACAAQKVRDVNVDIEGTCLRTKKNLPGWAGKIFFLTVIADYGLGEELVLVEVEVLVPGDPSVFTVVLEELDEPPAGDDLSMTVVLLSLFFSPGGVTVVSFCSQAARKAMLIKMQMYFMILRDSNPGS